MKSNPLYWLGALLGLYFLGVAAANLTGSPTIVQTFDTIGWGVWLRYLTAFCQILGGGAMLHPKTVRYGAVILTGVMLGAVVARLTVLGGNPLLAIILLALSAALAWNAWRPFSRKTALRAA